jgi:hypothetical protein
MTFAANRVPSSKKSQRRFAPAARASKSGSRYRAATYLTNAGIPVWVDTKVAIACNNFIVLDGCGLICEFGCLVLQSDGTKFGAIDKDALWDKYYTAAPVRLRLSVERYSIVKRA